MKTVLFLCDPKYDIDVDFSFIDENTILITNGQSGQEEAAIDYAARKGASVVSYHRRYLFPGKINKSMFLRAQIVMTMKISDEVRIVLGTRKKTNAAFLACVGVAGAKKKTYIYNGNNWSKIVQAKEKK